MNGVAGAQLVEVVMVVLVEMVGGVVEKLVEVELTGELGQDLVELRQL